MIIPITKDMNFQFKDVVSGFQGIKGQTVEFSKENLLCGYVYEVDKDNKPIRFRFFDNVELDIATEKDLEDSLITVYEVIAEYIGVTTLVTDDTIGMYPTFRLQDQTGTFIGDLCFYLKYATRHDEE